MKATELVQVLNELVTLHGDQEVKLKDADTGWLMDFDKDHIYMKDTDYKFAGIIISNEGYV
jgi:hypothetical protein